VQGAANDEQVLVEFGAVDDVELVGPHDPITYRPNLTDPGLGLDWVAEHYDDAAWTVGRYGIGYESVTGAETLIVTDVAEGTTSLYTRARFFIEDPGTVDNLWFGADYDDGVVAWINGVEVFRSPGLPAGDPAWDTDPGNHESSNGVTPDFEPQLDISALGIGLLHSGENVLAVAVYNHVSPSATSSSDLVLSPRLSMNRAPTMRYRTNMADPGLGLDWTAESFEDSAWDGGWYGVGYENSTGAEELLQTPVSPGTYSIYTRAGFDIENLSQVNNVHLGVDYDDGVVAWINGVEVFRSVEMPGGDPQWDSLPAATESSNRLPPRYEPIQDITAVALAALHPGSNVLAIGVWNRSPASSDLVLVPRLSINRDPDQQMRYLPNPGDPGIGLDWTDPAFDDAAWEIGAYGVGYETTSQGAHAHAALRGLR